jgi:hypothetical protein
MAIQQSWPAEREARCKQLIDEGKSASQIGREIGVSRSAVLGKAFRSGWRLGRKKQEPPA